MDVGPNAARDVLDPWVLIGTDVRELTEEIRALEYSSQQQFLAIVDLRAQQVRRRLILDNLT